MPGELFEGVIIKALSGFYYVHFAGETVTCRARGRFRLDGDSPLVGDRVRIERTEEDRGFIMEILPRRSRFVRPAVANVDSLIILASAVNPVTDPYLIDRVSAIAADGGCESVICVNKCDLDRGDALFDIYSRAGFTTIRTSAMTGEGVEELRLALRGRVCAFTGNSGVGKSSLLNALDPLLTIRVGEVSQKLGRGRHTTRHVEFFALGDDTFVADTPGFASFDPEMMEPIAKDQLQNAYREFEPYLGHCRFPDCAHLKEPGCAVLEAVKTGAIPPTRHNSYARMYELAAKVPDWERNAK